MEGGALGWCIYIYNGSKRLARINGQCMEVVLDLFFRSSLETHMRRVSTWIVLSCLGQLLFRHDYGDDDSMFLFLISISMMNVLSSQAHGDFLCVKNCKDPTTGRCRS